MTDSRTSGTDRAKSLAATVKRTGTSFIENQMTDKAAGLTYYGLLSLFPALIALVSLVGLFAEPEATTERLTSIISDLGPEVATDSIAGPVDAITSNRGASGVTFVFGLGLAIWSASGYVGAFGRASNVVYGIDESRPFWKLRAQHLALTLTLLLILTLLAIGLAMTGPVVAAVADNFGISSTALDIWGIAKWPVMALLVLLMVALLYHFSPDIDHGRIRFSSVGALVALAIWVLASAGFTFYVGNFGSYNETYGTLGGFVALLVWFWISNLAILFGQELNRELELRKQA